MFQLILSFHWGKSRRLERRLALYCEAARAHAQAKDRRRRRLAATAAYHDLPEAPQSDGCKRLAMRLDEIDREFYLETIGA